MNVACLLGESGIVDTSRRSKEQSRNVLRFFFQYVLEKDTNWNLPTEAKCACGSTHKIYPALWIAVLKNRNWVSIRKDKGEKPNAQYIGELLIEDNELLQMCKETKPSKLLNILGVSIGELMIHVAGKDEAD